VQQRPCASIVACLPADELDGYLVDSLANSHDPCLGHAIACASDSCYNIAVLYCQQRCTRL